MNGADSQRAIDSSCVLFERHTDPPPHFRLILLTLTFPLRSLRLSSLTLEYNIVYSGKLIIVFYDKYDWGWVLMK